MTNMRAAGKDENVVLSPVKPLTLEQAISFIREDELVEDNAQGRSPEKGRAVGPKEASAAGVAYKIDQGRLTHRVRQRPAHVTRSGNH